MKTIRFFKAITILLLLSNNHIPVFTQGSDYTVSYNTLVAGDTMILQRWDVGFWQPDTIWANLIPYELYYGSHCPSCMEDTIWSFRSEVIDDSTVNFYFAIPLGELPGTFEIATYSSVGDPYISGELITVHTPPIIFNQPQAATVCLGDSMAFEAKALGNSYDDLLFEWHHNDFKISQYHQGWLILPRTELHDTGVYYCIVSNQYGIDTTQKVRLDLHPFPSHPGTPVGPVRFCSGIDSTVYSIYGDPLAVGYDWHVIPREAGSIQQNDTTCTIFWDQAYSGIARLYVELIANCGMNVSDTLEITIPGISIDPEICIVGIDEQTGNYRILWERSAYGSAQLFRVYRESNQAELYLEIGTVYISETSFFVDSSSVPDMLPHRYKISYLDTCGLESEMSLHHQTMHLVANIGVNGQVNLDWSAYEGIPFPTYSIYRGSHPDSINLYINVPSTVTSFTDVEPILGDVYYQIGMSNPAGCDPVRKSESDYSSSMSNMDQVNVTGITDAKEGEPFMLFPNPVTDDLQIRYKDNVSNPIQFAIYNSLGKAVYQEYIRADETRVDVSSLLPGIYILRTLGDSETNAARFVIRNK